MLQHGDEGGVPAAADAGAGTARKDVAHVMWDGVGQVEVAGRGCMLLTCHDERVVMEDLTPRPGEPVAQALARDTWHVRRGDLHQLFADVVRVYASAVNAGLS